MSHEAVLTIRWQRALWTLAAVVLAFRTASLLPHWGSKALRHWGAAPASWVALYLGLGVAIPLLWGFRRPSVRWRRSSGWRFLGAWVYLVALASLADSLSASLVFVLLPRFEAAWLMAQGIPAWMLPLPALLTLLALTPTLRDTSDFVTVELLRHPEAHRRAFRQAIGFKLSAGVLLISLLRSWRQG